MIKFERGKMTVSGIRCREDFIAKEIFLQERSQLCQMNMQNAPIEADHLAAQM